jgi:hypothetical protein
MSPSSPVRTRQSRRSSHPSQAGSSRSQRGETIAFVVRSIPLIVAALSIIATSNYLAYLIGRKQVTYEELRNQVDRVVQLVGQTSTINGKTTVAPEPAPAGRPIAAALTDDTAVAPPDREVRLQPPESPLNAATKHREMHGVAHQRSARRQKASPTSAAPRRGPADPAGAAQSRQLTTATPATPDASLAGQ